MFKNLSFLMCILKNYLTLLLVFPYDSPHDSSPSTAVLDQAQLQGVHKRPKTLKVQEKRPNVFMFFSRFQSTVSEYQANKQLLSNSTKPDILLHVDF